MYPTVVIVLVETQRSMTDICEGLSNASRIAGPVPSDHEAHAETFPPPSRAVQGRDMQEHGSEKAILGVKC